MLTVEHQDINSIRRELMKQLSEINKVNKVSKGFDYLTEKEHDEIMKKIEGRVIGFFRHGTFDRDKFNNYLFELGDPTKADRLLGIHEFAVYDERSGLRMDAYDVSFKNIYVEYAKQLAWKIYEDYKNRKGADPILGHYQRLVRTGIKQLEHKLSTGDRKRIVQLLPFIMYENKIDIEKVAKIWGCSRQAALKNIKALTDEEKGQVIMESKSGRKKVYSFNRKYIFSGSGGNKKNYDVKIYVDYLKKVIKSVEEIETNIAKEFGVKELTHSALSTLHTIIPYFHFQTFYAVLNPLKDITIGDESVWEARERELKYNEDSKLEFIDIGQLARILAKKEADLNYTKRDLYILEKAGAIIFTPNTILVNPKLMFCMGDHFNSENDPYVTSVELLFKTEEDARKGRKNREADIKKMLYVKKKSSEKTRIKD